MGRRHMQTLERILFVIAACFCHAAVAATVTADFDTDPAWSVVGSGQNGNDLGYRSTSNAGGNPGEVGGRFTRSSFVRQYADTGIGQLSLDDPISASGLLNVTDYHFPDFGPGVLLGHFATDSFAGVGLIFNNSNTESMYVDLVVRFADDVEHVINTRMAGPIQAGVARTWSYSWDPHGGAGGFGSLSGSLSGVDGGSVVIELTESERAQAPSFDAFGLSSQATSPLSGNRDRSDWYGDFCIDNVQYTAAVPEPDSLGLALVGLAVLGVTFTRRRNVANATS